jgi:RNA polymerase sigma-70 factor (ECF subfamily)
LKESCVDNEPAIIQRAQKGDHDAFAALVNEHQRYVYNLAFRVVRDENEALDLTQETFVRAWRHAQTYDPRRGRVASWLLTIARNLAISIPHLAVSNYNQSLLQPPTGLASFPQ